MLPQSQEIKETTVSFTINKMLQFCIWKVGGFKRSDVVVTSIRRGSADNMVLNPTLDIFSVITCGGWNFQGEKHILIHLNVFKHCVYV